MTATEGARVKEQHRTTEFPWKIARKIHEELFPQSAEFYRNADRRTVTLFSLASLKNMAEAYDLESALTSSLQFYETLLYLH